MLGLKLLKATIQDRIRVVQNWTVIFKFKVDWILESFNKFQKNTRR